MLNCMNRLGYVLKYIDNICNNNRNNIYVWIITFGAYKILR